MDNNSLTHHGILGMKWGRRRYQNKDGSLTAAGKKRYGDDDPEAAKKAYEEGKQRAIKSGSATEVLKYKGDLTKQEMDEVRNRLNWERDIKNISDAEIAAGKSASDKFFSNMSKATDRAQTLAKFYNMGANIWNAFSGTDSISLPKIDTNISNDNKKTRKEEKKERKKAQEAAKKRAEQEAQRESKQKERAEKRARENARESAKTETFTGEVFGEGKSKANRFNSQAQRTKSNSDYTIINGDGLFKDVTNTPEVRRYITSGQSYVNDFLLEEPKR